MSSSVRERSKKSGLPPGTLIHIGEKKTEGIRITLIKYDETSFLEQEVRKVRECLPYLEGAGVAWINIDGMHQVDVIEEIGQFFTLHPLLLEDILNTGQRPKLEDYGPYLFLVLRMLSLGQRERFILSEQVSVILGPNYVLSFQEREGDVFESIRDRLRKAKGRIRKMGPDYLAYSLLDAIVDGYFPILEKIEERIEGQEEELLISPAQATVREIHRLKREMTLLRKSIWPLREVINRLTKGDSPLIQESTHWYLKDVYDHTIQIIETIDESRELLAGMLDLYLSSLSNRMNEIMKVLTIFASLFIPLTFIVGVYGMNFKHFPELEWRWGYPFIWLVMLMVSFFMLLYFKRKKWL
ncbi:MAG: magnesium/cobalt transporter CorA [bacterium]